MNEIAVVKSQIQLENWTEMVRNCRASGLTVEQWCQENGLNTKTYYYRQRKVRQAALLQIQSDAARNDQPIFGKVPVPASYGGAVTVHLPYASIDVAAGTDEQTIKAVLMALKSTC